MKASPFRYACPDTIEEAVALLAVPDIESKIIAGGQSLMPILAFRLAAPDVLVDVRKLRGLDRIAIGSDGIRLGARVRWCDIEADERLATAHPLLAAAIDHVAHYQIRNRGTVGGSVAHADSAAEMPGIAATCDGELTVISARGSRVIPAQDFFLGPLTTSLEPNELITEIRLPPWPAARRWGFEEFARRRGDFALAGVAVFYDEDAQGRATNTHIGVIGACNRPQRMAEIESVLDGRRVDGGAIAEAAAAIAEAVDPFDDLHASAEYRRDLTATLLERALLHASAPRTAGKES